MQNPHLCVRNPLIVLLRKHFLASLFAKLGLLLLALFIEVTLAQEYVGSATCATCHEAEWDKWQQSHHFQAMTEASAETVLADFGDQVVEFADGPSRFFKENDTFFVETLNGEGELARFPISHTLGFEPLQQYLVQMPDGRLQALSIAWDSRSAEGGGQRWFHLYPNEAISPDDPLHWTGSFQNANSRCIACHTTGYDKGYEQESNTYQSRWEEGMVGCEACHGPGSDHLAWTEIQQDLAGAGFSRELGNLWQAQVGERPFTAEAALGISEQIQVCAACHSRRNELQTHDPAAGFHDNYQLSPLREGLYHADGQILDEVYVAGSFLQSRMFQAHVSCGNCHDAHSMGLLVEGNGLCLQCHEAGVFQSKDHLLHAADSLGGQCVSCHMPETTYMGVDPRRDHSLRIPDPLANLETGTPDVCSGCHTEEDAQWAVAILAERSGGTAPHYAHTLPIAAARQGNSAAAPELIALATDASQPGMIRSIALIESAGFPSQQHMRAVLQARSSPDPIVRASAAEALGFLDVVGRLSYLAPLLAESAKAVRMTVARQLNAMPVAQLSAADRDHFVALMAEYEQSLLYNADMPEAMSELGLHYAARGDLQAAATVLSKARDLSPGYLPALLNLADVYRALGRDGDAEPLLEDAIQRYPESADAQHALGLLYVRSGRTEQSLPLFREAAQLNPDNPRFALVHGLALSETGQPGDAVQVLEAARQRFPDHVGVRNALQSLLP